MGKFIDQSNNGQEVLFLLQDTDYFMWVMPEVLGACVAISSGMLDQPLAAL